MNRHGHKLCGLLFFCLLALASTKAMAQQVRCDIHAIQASSSGSEISPALDAYRNHLMRGPLTSFTSFRLINTQSLSLTQGRSGALRLPHNITGELRLASIDGQHRVFDLELLHNQRNLVTSTFRTSQGHPFFVVVGTVIPSGTLVLGIICR